MASKRKRRRWLIALVVGLPVFYLATALILVVLPEPTFSGPPAYSEADAIADGMTVEQIYAFESDVFEMPDGTVLDCRRFVSDAADSIVFVHGASGFSSQLNKSSGLLRDATGMEVFAIDLRGHGNSSGARGDLEYVGQYEDDLANVITAVREMKPTGRIILAGHSMGGGIVQRYAMREEFPVVEGYILFTPAMGMGLPTKFGINDNPSVKIHLPRIIGLRMLNLVGIRQFNHEKVVFLQFPQFESHLNSYTFNAVASMLPSDYKSALKAIDKPLLVFLGGSDSLSQFDPAVIAEAVTTYSNGEVMILDEEGHHVHNNPEAIARVAAWIEKGRVSKNG